MRGDRADAEYIKVHPADMGEKGVDLMLFIFGIFVGVAVSVMILAFLDASKDED